MIIDKEAARKAANALEFLLENQDTIERIMDIVQENQAFFNARLGESKLKAAADKMEELTKKPKSVAPFPPLSQRERNRVWTE